MRSSLIPFPLPANLPTFTICSCGDRDEDGHGNQLNGELGETLVKAAIQGLGHVFEGRGRRALGGVDLTSSTGKLTMTVINTVAEFQCDLLIERTQVGLSRAKGRGQGAWQTPSLTDDQRKAVERRLKEGATVSALAREINTSRNTIMSMRDAKACTVTRLRATRP